MSSFTAPISVKSAVQAGKVSSNLVMAIAPIISEALVQNMEQEQEQKAKDEAKKAKDEAKKAEKSKKISSFN